MTSETLQQQIDQVAPAIAASLLAISQMTAPIAPATATVPQPDQNGEFVTPADGAIWMAIVHGKRQTPLSGKAAILSSWPESASTDPAQISESGISNMAVILAPLPTTAKFSKRILRMFVSDLTEVSRKP